MSNRFLYLLLGISLLFSALSEAYGQKSPDFIKYDLKDLVKRSRRSDTTITFLSENTIEGRIAHLEKNRSNLISSEYDEVYFVVNGNGKLKAGNKVLNLGKDSIIYIPKNMKHAVFEISSPLYIIELTSFESKSNGDTSSVFHSVLGAEADRSKGNNIWNPFLKRQSMTLGLYMLPQKLNGDSALVHKWDELNLITKGNGKFQVGNKIMSVSAGDIIYVRKGNPHFFHSLRTDMDILILFEKRSVQ